MRRSSLGVSGVTLLERYLPKHTDCPVAVDFEGQPVVKTVLEQRVPTEEWDTVSREVILLVIVQQRAAHARGELGYMCRA